MIPLYTGSTFEHEYYSFWEEFLTEEEIQNILALPQWSSLLPGKIYGTGLLSDEHDSSRRSSKINWITSDTEEWLWQRLQVVVAQVNREFFRFDLSGFHEGIQLSLYSAESKGHYTWHTDGPMPRSGGQRTNNNAPRKLSMSLLLSDPSEFDGGKLLLKTDTDTPVECESKKGRAWFFPSFTLHCVTPVTRGVRKSLVLWAGGPAFK
jgi:PKHD-type hydroxylase